MLENKKPQIFLVDDDPALRESLQLVLKNDFSVSSYSSGSEALDALSVDFEDCKRNIDIALLDVMMPGIDGIELLKQIKSKMPSVPVVMLSASNTVKTAVQAMKLGAVDFISKPFEVDELTLKLNQISSKHNNYSDTSGVNSAKIIKENKPETINGDFGLLVGSHPLMQEVYQKVSHVAHRNTTVLISGESGTGKELIARELHKNSERSEAPFVAINCAAIPESLVESELFGHEKGSFTHALERRVGHFELADGGTIFLDEIGELPPSIQVKLLRVLQEREFYRIGSSKPVEVDVRIITATNKSLERAVEEGRFRKDLFFRINVVSIELPPLRKRKDDTPKLVDFFINKLSTQYGNKKPKTTDEFISCLMDYNWPGNVRELENVIECIMALSTSDPLETEDIPQRLRVKNKQTNSLKDKVVEGVLPFEEAERKFETEIITRALQKTNNVQTKAAELLGISRRILKYKMDKLGIDVTDTE